MSQLHVEVCRIDAIERHPNADTLSIAHVKGWQTIIKTDSFHVGDLCVYVPVDSIIPDALIQSGGLEYLRQTKGRVKTIKLRQSVSQGLILTASDPKWREGQDVAAQLGVTKWEPPTREPQVMAANGKPRRLHRNPAFRVYTDIDNIKHYPDLFAAGEGVVVTEKIHGSNVRMACLERPSRTLWQRIKRFFSRDRHEFVYGSHKVQLGIHGHPNYYGENVYGQVAEKYRVKDALEPGMILYGEVFGPKIQDLTYGLKQVEARFFDLMVDGRYVDWGTFAAFCYEHDLPTVPVLYRGPYDPEKLDGWTTGNSVICPSQIREGCVVKPVREQNCHMGRKVLKSLSPDYLLRKGGTEFH